MCHTHTTHGRSDFFFILRFVFVSPPPPIIFTYIFLLHLPLSGSLVRIHGIHWLSYFYCHFRSYLWIPVCADHMHHCHRNIISKWKTIRKKKHTYMICYIYMRLFIYNINHTPHSNRNDNYVHFVCVMNWSNHLWISCFDEWLTHRHTAHFFLYVSSSHPNKSGMKMFLWKKKKVVPSVKL